MLEWTGHTPPVKLNNGKDLDDYYRGFDHAYRGKVFDPPKEKTSRAYYEIGFKVAREEKIPEHLMEKVID